MSVGVPIDRVDGRSKVTGSAVYTSDNRFPHMAYAVPVCSAISSGELTGLDIGAARHMPGVVDILHHGNVRKLAAIPEGEASPMIDERRPPLSDTTIRYFGQYVALVIAETFETATAAAARVRPMYRAGPTHGIAEAPAKVTSQRGDVEAAFASAPVRIDATYGTPAETHNPIELHASVAVWDGDSVTLYETSQAVDNHRKGLAVMLGLPDSRVRVISRFLGSGFGGKLWPWPQSVLAAVAAQHVRRPVKLVVTRDMMFQNVGHRPDTHQRVRLAATTAGKLVALDHDYWNTTSVLDDYVENCGEATPYFYSTPNLRVRSAFKRRNIGTPTAMRGPGAVPGLFATESAYDELAIALNVDPVKLRLDNEPAIDEGLKIPFSSRHYPECLTVGAQKFGWSARTPGVGSMTKDGAVLGWGVAGAAWIGDRDAAEASVDLNVDGTVDVRCGTQDIGTGTYTVLAQVAAHATGTTPDKVRVGLGDTNLPPGPASGGSMVTASVIPAVVQAANNALAAVNASTALPFPAALLAARKATVRGVGKSAGTFGEKNPTVSRHSFGAHFVEVRWQPGIARLRVSRIVTVMDAGRIINPKTAANQIAGAVVMGIGMALFEETRYDERTVAPLNRNLADYVVSTNADTPKIDVTFLDHPDLSLNELGARGVGEIGLAGIAPAITAAVYHATGRRIRQLPVRIEDLL